MSEEYNHEHVYRCQDCDAIVTTDHYSSIRELSHKAGYQAGITAALEALGEDDDPDSNQDFNYKKWAQHRNRLRDEVRTRIEKLREDNHDT